MLKTHDWNQSLYSAKVTTAAEFVSVWNKNYPNQLQSEIMCTQSSDYSKEATALSTTNVSSLSPSNHATLTISNTNTFKRPLQVPSINDMTKRCKSLQFGIDENIERCRIGKFVSYERRLMIRLNVNKFNNEQYHITYTSYI